MSQFTLNDSKPAMDWKNEVAGILQVQFPDASKKDIRKFLEAQVENTMKSSSAELRNNHRHQSLKLDLVTFYTWVKAENPIIAGYGTFFKNQDQEINPVATMLDEFMILRKKFKGLLKHYEPHMYEYKQADQDQLGEKVNANSYYGCSGAKTSNFYNIFTAAAVTSTGQALIATTEQAFEAFVSGNGYKFEDMDQCYTFMSNVISDKNIFTYDFEDYISIDVVMDRIRSMFYDPEIMNEDMVYGYLMGCTPEQISRIYYKNNLYEFIKIPMISDIIRNTLLSTDSFKDPNKIPNNMKRSIEKLWSYVKEFVAYMYSPVSRVARLKRDERESVVGVDTDSNMVYLYPWVKAMDEQHVSVVPELTERNPDEMIFMSVNIICYLKTQMITALLYDHTTRSNVLEPFKHRINMKNEFLFWKMIFSNTKKRYVTLTRLREGQELNPPKLDVKGIDFMKSTTREATKAEMIRITQDSIMETDDISIPVIYKQLSDLQSKITDSVLSGSKEFLIPISVKEIEAYKEPMRNQGIKATIVWNMAYPDETIELPAKIDIVKVRITRVEDLDIIKDIEPVIYDRLVKGIFNGHHEKFVKGGVNVIGLPASHKEVPEWICRLTDVGVITNDNMSRFNPIITSLGISTISGGTKTYISNILSI